MISGYMRRQPQIDYSGSCVGTRRKEEKREENFVDDDRSDRAWDRPRGRRGSCRPALYQGAADGGCEYNWSGFYAGINGGWGSSRNRWDETSLGIALSEGSHDATGGTVGGQIGYRWQAASWVFGVEAQGNWADFHGSNVIPLAAAFTNDTRVDAFGLFTGQVGYAANNVLFYLKGGAAVTSDRYRVLATGTDVSTRQQRR